MIVTWTPKKIKTSQTHRGSRIKISRRNNWLKNRFRIYRLINCMTMTIATMPLAVNGIELLLASSSNITTSYVWLWEPLNRSGERMKSKNFVTHSTRNSLYFHFHLRWVPFHLHSLSHIRECWRCEVDGQNIIPKLVNVVAWLNRIGQTFVLLRSMCAHAWILISLLLVVQQSKSENRCTQKMVLNTWLDANHNE